MAKEQIIEISKLENMFILNYYQIIDFKSI